MSDLIALQEQMTSAILSGNFAGVASEFRAGKANAEKRLNIFRNNTFSTLTDSLKTVFPVTVKLSDERFFAYAAHEFIAKRPPSEARLSRYGRELPRFLASFEPCRAFPIIAEMASLEWAIAECLNGAAETAMAMSAIGKHFNGGGEFGLGLQPNLQFAISRWPILGVWADHRREKVSISEPLKRQVSRIAVSRKGDDIQFTALDAPRFAFWRSLVRGQTMEAAAARALNRDRLFDLVRETVLLFRSELVTGINFSA